MHLYIIYACMRFYFKSGTGHAATLASILLRPSNMDAPPACRGVVPTIGKIISGLQQGNIRPPFIN